MLNEVKHLAIAREILRCAQNDIVHHLTCDTALIISYNWLLTENNEQQTTNNELIYPVRKNTLPFRKRKILYGWWGLKPHTSFLTGFTLSSSAGQSSPASKCPQQYSSSGNSP
jgi:hypothetical protein